MESIYSINLAGFDLKVCSTETEAETTVVVKAVNRKIREFEQNAKGAPKMNAILLTCMDLCDENRKLKARQQELSEKISALRAQLSETKKALREATGA